MESKCSGCSGSLIRQDCSKHRIECSCGVAHVRLGTFIACTSVGKLIKS